MGRRSPESAALAGRIRQILPVDRLLQAQKFLMRENVERLWAEGLRPPERRVGDTKRGNYDRKGLAPKFGRSATLRTSAQLRESRYDRNRTVRLRASVRG